jgi:uncharacterized protein (DUF952 family)
MTNPSDSCIFHICTRDAAVAARVTGEYRAPSLDSEGFIHMSQAHQVRGVLDAFYAGQPDLVLLVVDPGLVTSPLRHEPPGPMPTAATLAQISPDQLFPHIYGPLNADAILDIVDVARFHSPAVHRESAPC